MTPFYSDDWLTVYGGDCRAVLASLPADSVDCVVTSPPYFGLRDYGTATWNGGDAECDHSIVGPGRAQRAEGGLTCGKAHVDAGTVKGGDCGRCGATRSDGQLGLEPTPEQYVANLVAVFREVRRVLKPSGTCWLNLGDSYTSGGRKTRDPGQSKIHPALQDWQAGRASNPAGLKDKDLVGIPWLVARALQEPYYTGRIAKERDRAWLAAMIDGEGTVCGFDHDRADGGGHRSGVHVTITNSSTALLDEAARIWPASRSEHERPGAGHLGQRQTWRWIVHGIANKQAILRELYPHLIAKRQQAVVAYTLLDLMANAKRLGHSPQKDAVLVKRRVLTGLLSDLNHQRPVVMPSWIVEPPSLYEPGWYLRSDIIWSKPNPMPESVTDRPTKAHEYLFLLTKSARYYYDAKAIAEQVAESTVRRLAQPTLDEQRGSSRVPGKTNGPMKASAPRFGGAKYGDNGSDHHRTKSGDAYVLTDLRNARSVWTIATQPYADAHFAVFPPELPKRCIKAGCPESGVVLDPFAGSGTVGMVANRLSRRAVLIDLNPEYLKQQMKRNAQTPLGLRGQEVAS